MWNELDKFEDTKKGVISSCKWKDRKYHGPKKRDKKTNNDLHTTKDKATRTSLKSVGERRCSGRISSSCSTCGTCRVTLVTNPVIIHE